MIPNALSTKREQQDFRNDDELTESARQTLNELKQTAEVVPTKDLLTQSMVDQHLEEKVEETLQEERRQTLATHDVCLVVCNTCALLAMLYWISTAKGKWRKALGILVLKLYVLVAGYIGWRFALSNLLAFVLMMVVAGDSPCGFVGCSPSDFAGDPPSEGTSLLSVRGVVLFLQVCLLLIASYVVILKSLLNTCIGKITAQNVNMSPCMNVRGTSHRDRIEAYRRKNERD